jgi:hypothetical protein
MLLSNIAIYFYFSYFQTSVAVQKTETGEWFFRLWKEVAV